MGLISLYQAAGKAGRVSLSTRAPAFCRCSDYLTDDKHRPRRMRHIDHVVYCTKASIVHFISVTLKEWISTNESAGKLVGVHVHEHVRSNCNLKGRVLIAKYMSNFFYHLLDVGKFEKNRYALLILQLYSLNQVHLA